MTRMTRSSCCLLSALFAFGADVPDQRSHAAGITPRYGITDLGVMPGTTKSIATGINSSGHVVGVSYNNYNSLHRIYDDGKAPSFLYSNGTTTEIHPTGGPALAINDSDQVVGGGFVAINNRGQYVGTPDPDNGPFVMVDGGTSTILQMIPNVITESGTIGGHFFTGGGSGRAALLQNGQLNQIHDKINRFLGGLPYKHSTVVAINRSDDALVSVMTPNGQSHTVLYEKGFPTLLDSLPGATSFEIDARAINDQGQIVGAGFLYEGGSLALTPDGPRYQPGQFLPLKDLIPEGLGWSDLVATAINDEGLIVGQGTINGQQRAFLMTPAAVPEPATIVVFGALTLWCGVHHRRRRRELRRQDGECSANPNPCFVVGGPQG